MVPIEMNAQKEVGRNDPCPCGSGKKYKTCCGRSQAPVHVLYIHPAKYAVDAQAGDLPLGRPYGLVPMGLVAIVNQLRDRGIPVKGLNYPLERQLNSKFDLRGWLAEQSEIYVILIDLHWYEHAYGAISLARACKEVLPDAAIIVGGLTSSAFPTEILRDYPAIDYLIRGDAEKPVFELVRHLLQVRSGTRKTLDLRHVPNLSYRQGDQIIENDLSYVASPSDLDRLNFVDLDFLEHEDQYYIREYIVTDMEVARSSRDKSMYRGRWLCNARGCDYDCYFCGGCSSAHEALAGRTGLVVRSPAALVDDIKRMAENRIIQVSFSYDIAELGDAYWQELFARLRDSGIKIGLYNEVFHMPSPKFIEEFVKVSDMTHSCIALSPLTGSMKVRQLNGKYFTDDELFDILDLLNMCNVPIFVYFSLNLLGENDETIRESVELAKRIFALYPSSLLKILNTLHTIDPLSPLSVHPEEYGVEKTIFTFADYYDYCRETQFNHPGARTELHRGFTPLEKRSLEFMSDIWDEGRVGREQSWWPIPPGW
jgi:radical SAM superfamily enzyme YgiQ (UPF0313 family)